MSFTNPQHDQILEEVGEQEVNSEEIYEINATYNADTQTLVYSIETNDGGVNGSETLGTEKAAELDWVYGLDIDDSRKDYTIQSFFSRGCMD